MRPTIQIINNSTVISNAALKPMVDAIQIQVSRDFSPIWNMNANLFLLPEGQKPDPKAWWLLIADDSDQASALGYHDYTNGGLPLGKVFAKTDIMSGSSISVTMSHEVLEMLSDPFVNSCIVDPTGSRFWAQEPCLHGDTRVSLLNGTEIAIKDLIGVPELWVYSYDNDSRRIVPGRAHSVRRTKCNAPTVTVRLDDGSSFVCTPDHRVMRRDGSYTQAKHLSAGDSLMPLYRRMYALSGRQPLEYEQLLQPHGSWEYTHRVVCPNIARGHVRHHKDFNRFNNDPNNLEVLEWHEHRNVHAAAIRRIHSLPQTRAAASRTITAFNKTRKGKPRTDLQGPRPYLSAEHRAASGERGRKALIAYNKSDAHRAISGSIGRKKLAALRETPEYNELIAKINGARMRELNATPAHRAMLKAVCDSPGFKAIASATAIKNNHQRWHAARGVLKPGCDLCSKFNHKVVSVEVSDHADVYDMSVDKYHNFALTSGVFVHNCDAVESDQFGYNITLPTGEVVLVSDFQTRAWYGCMPGDPSKQVYDFCRHCTEPFQVLSGGYASAFDVRSQQWIELGADSRDLASRKPHGSRFDKRRRFRDNQCGKLSEVEL